MSTGRVSGRSRPRTSPDHRCSGTGTAGRRFGFGSVFGFGSGFVHSFADRRPIGEPRVGVFADASRAAKRKRTTFRRDAARGTREDRTRRNRPGFLLVGTSRGDIAAYRGSGLAFFGIRGGGGVALSRTENVEGRGPSRALFLFFRGARHTIRRAGRGVPGAGGSSHPHEASRRRRRVGGVRHGGGSRGSRGRYREVPRCRIEVKEATKI